MLLAVNYSHEAAALLSQQRIRFDRFKTPPWPDMIAEARQYLPVQVHFELRAGRDALINTDWDAVEAFLIQTGTQYVNLHLSLHKNEIPKDLPPADLPRWTTASLIADVERAVARFGAERVIVENVPYRRGETKKTSACVLPGVISQVIRATRVGLLLDISHARISAASLGMPAGDYLRALPLDQLRELHFTGIHTWEDGGLMDHLPILPEDWPWLDWVLKGIREEGWGEPGLLAFEYGGVGKFFKDHSDINVLAEQVPMLAERLAGQP